MELGSKLWKLVFGDGTNRRRVTIEAGHLAQFGEALTKAKEKFCLPGDVLVVSCYEGGRDGLWLHRYLLSKGIQNQVGIPRVSKSTGTNAVRRPIAWTGSSC